MQRPVKYRLNPLKKGVLPLVIALMGTVGSSLMGCSPAQNQMSTARAPQFQSLNTQDLTRYYPIAPGMQWQYTLQQSQDGQDNTRYHTMQITQEALPQDSATATPASAILRRSYPESPQQPRPGLARRFGDRVELSHYQESAVSTFMTSPAGLPLPANTAQATTSPLTAQGTVGFIVALKTPLSPGNAWPGRQFQGGSETLSIKTLEKIETPAGTFDTLCVEHHIRYDNGREDFLRYWYAPQVGMVKMHEEITFYTDRWSKFVSTGILSGFQRP